MLASFWETVENEAIKAVFMIVLLLFTWLVGRRIINYWDLRKKRQELDLAAARSFHQLFGEFKDIWRIWKVYQYDGNDRYEFTDEERQKIRFDLLHRATRAEGGVEAIVLKLATERKLSKEELASLGMFRQAYQKLREAIRNGTRLHWQWGKANYMLFNDGACEVAAIINTQLMAKKADVNGLENLRAIISVRDGNWRAAITASNREAEADNSGE
ncbi:MAG: hypothetical protein V3T86_02890 [Planctomycetota bacterium]